MAVYGVEVAVGSEQDLYRWVSADVGVGGDGGVAAVDGAVVENVSWRAPPQPFLHHHFRLYVKTGPTATVREAGVDVDADDVGADVDAGAVFGRELMARQG